jgi:hypothetical protein
LTAWRCKSASHPDGGEVIAKRKGVVAMTMSNSSREFATGSPA